MKVKSGICKLDENSLRSKIKVNTYSHKPLDRLRWVSLESCLFGVHAVGGEFPVAASSASERAESSEKLKALRGQTVVLVFSMQACSHNLLDCCFPH